MPRALLFLLVFLSAVIGRASELPSLGDNNASTFSKQQEYELGRAWLRSLKGQAPIIEDPLVLNFVEELVYRIAPYSELKELNLELVVVNSPELNAFAVPGGVMGINSGLFLYAKTEGQMASVISHELAHLSQRHFARQLEDSQRKQPLELAALLTSILLIASGNGEAGIAGLAVTQAATIQSYLSFSRENEKEADRIGFKTLAKSGFSPYSMPAMFQEMLNTQRYSIAPPEYLLTHPITESRVADAYNRANNYKEKNIKIHLDYQLIRTRLQVYHNNRADIVDYYATQLAQALLPLDKTIMRYALALAQDKQGQHKLAVETFRPLIDEFNGNLIFQYSYAQLLIADQQTASAINHLTEQLAGSPTYLPFNMLLVEGLNQQKDFSDAEKVLKKLSLKYSQNTQIWYELAEISGLAGNILQVHQARAEYFFLTSRYALAIQQLQFAQKLTNNNFQLTSKLNTRIKYFESVKNMQF
jgi:predicted Zn-dependent protease